MVLTCLKTEAQTTLIPYNSSWKYLANGSNQGTAWIGSAFSDAAWPAGNGQLGYGDGDEATVVPFGPNASARYITTYFRKTILVSDPSVYQGFTFNIKRDDGIILYLNGTEIYRNNLAAGAITYTTLATLAADDGNGIQTVSISPASMSPGNNTLAAEIHQNAGTSSDISFDLELIGIPVPFAPALISFGSNWKYKDDGSNQGTTWTASGFNDASWPSGNGQLGFGDGDEATVVSYGPAATNKYITTYFRKSFTVADSTLYSSYTVNLKRDDGAVVYINGKEVFRSNMPTGTISYTTKASTAAADDGAIVQPQVLDISKIRNGVNVIAVEIHQNVASSPDLSFDLELKANLKTTVGATLVRGPYMNLARQYGVVIRWRTNIPTNSQVSFGTVAGNLTRTYTNLVLTTEHEVALTGLVANTKYFYNFGSTSQIIQGDASNYFKTLPSNTSVQKLRFLAMGDMGNNSTNQVNVRNAWLTYNGTNYTDGWILLGDNAYNTGTDAEYQTNFFNIYQGSMTKNHVLWPAPGNHDYANLAARQADHAIPYFSNFTLPKAAEAGGLASGTEAYYSYNMANVHFVALDSYGWETGNTRLYDTLGPQAVWLKQDLALNTKPWTIVYFHHPPYTKTSHNSDAETELINIRQKLVPILERYKVDLVLNGHSHGYERSYPIQGHYGLETTFDPLAHALSTSSGKYDGTANSCTYVKNTADIRNGVVYAVVGSSGQLGGSSAGYPHSAMYYSNITNPGALYFEVENNRLLAKWIGSDGVVRDNFTIMKNVNKSNTITTAPGVVTTLTASWIGSYLWSTGVKTKSNKVSPSITTTYSVTDGKGCVTDLFTVQVPPARKSTSEDQPEEGWMYPTVLHAGEFLHIDQPINQLATYDLIDVQGKVLKTWTLDSPSDVLLPALPAGIYTIRSVGRYGKLIVE